MLASLVRGRPEAVAAIPGSEGGWSYTYSAGDRGNGQKLLFHGLIVA
jgi:hypothetical protein